MATSRYFQAAHDVIVKTLDQSLTGQLDNFSSIASQLGKYGISILYIVVCLYHNSWEAKNRSAGFFMESMSILVNSCFCQKYGGVVR
uniref:Integral inner membrane protein of type IV secretion complex (VirB6) n=1 Tax=Escherichia coli TaxID=562 RepID=A0A1L4BKX4_ECOLX|nr:Integral inner membrane protein of type IV secretion complex (VirB6) [Escherichia coli]